MDNASTDGTLTELKRIKNITLIKNSKNKGLSGYNDGANSAKGEVLVILDQDVLPYDENLLTNVAELFSRNSSKFILAFKIYSYFSKTLMWDSPKYNKENKRDTGFLTAAFNGSGWAIRTKDFLDIGGFKDYFFIYYNDIEFATRALRRGFKIILEPRFKVFHKKNPEFVQKRGKSAFYTNKLLLAWSWEHMPAHYFLFKFLKAVIQSCVDLFSLDTHGFVGIFSFFSDLFNGKLKRNPLPNNVYSAYKKYTKRPLSQ